MTIAGISNTEEVLYDNGEIKLTKIKTLVLETNKISDKWIEKSNDKTIIHDNEPEWYKIMKDGYSTHR